jgi:hypothetical protein
MSAFKLELGQEGKDKITGFKGILTSRVEYLTGCNQYGITPSIGTDGKLGEIHYFDEGRIEIIVPGINAAKVKSKKMGVQIEMPQKSNYNLSI